MKSFNAIVVACFAVLLTSCGGSNWSPTPSSRLETAPPARTEPIVASALSFPLKTAMEESYKFATYTNYAVYGMCSGNSTNSSQAPVPATFEGITGFSVISSETITFTDCTPPSISATGTSYFDGNFVPVGSSVNGGEYGVYLTPPVVPVSVQVGDTGTIGTKTAYSDSTKSNVVGHDDMTYVIEPDTASTAIVDLINKSYDSNGVLLITTHNRFKILPAGYLIPYSVDIRSSALHLVLVAVPDTLPLSVVSTTVPPASAITATFSKPMEVSSLNASTVSVVSDAGDVVIGNISLSGRTLTFTPNGQFPRSGIYTFSISRGVKDIFGIALSTSFSQTFAVDLATPSVVSTSPANLMSGASLTTTVSATLSKLIDPASVGGSGFVLMDGVNAISGVAAVSDATITFTPAEKLLPNKTYTATVTTGVADRFGITLPSNYSWSFTTENVLFMSPVNFSGGANLDAVAIGDVNGDGRNDVVTSNTFSGVQSSQGVLVYLQNTSGVLDSPILYTTSKAYACYTHSIAIGDVNHDGRNDVVTGSSGCGMEVFVQNASGLLDAGFVYPSRDDFMVRIADLNNDGLQDVVSIGWGSGTVSVWNQNLAGTLNAPATYNVNHGGYEDLDVGDLNNDGLTDIVVLDGQGTNQFGVLTQSAGGLFNVPVYYADSGAARPSGVAVGDVNGDGKNDAVVTYAGNSPTSKVGVFYQNALGGLDASVGLVSYDMPSAIEIADVTGDGRKDVLVEHWGWHELGVYEQLSGGTLKAEKLYSAPYGGWNTQGLAIGDINSDGKPDAVYSGITVLYHY